MTPGDESLPEPSKPDLPDLAEIAGRMTPARLFVGRAGESYDTRTQMRLRLDHAFARDAVQADIDPRRDLGAEFVYSRGLVEAQTMAPDKATYLRAPDLGRKLDDESKAKIVGTCPRGIDLQIAIGDGLSATAVVAQVPDLLPRIERGAMRLGWTLGRPVFIRHCRVGVMNDLGDLLDPRLVLLLIGERPGLATAESLSAYMAFRPRAGDTDARRNLISNIHARGVPPDQAAPRILAYLGRLLSREESGVSVKEPDMKELGDPLPPRERPNLPPTTGGPDA